ncbi:FAD dependent oxidoreductase [Xylariomycetidae sp. FL0641]|nr:FAD dependent oxidoreductase [Xylariomycetidae sp. FL0641]
MASTTVILGAGIIGVSTAHYLSQHQPGRSIHLVEPSARLFASASGFAGGFLARDWHGFATADLAARSFDEHRRLAEAHDGAANWGYAPSTSISFAQARGGGRDRGKVDVWCRDGASRANAAAGADGDAPAVDPPKWLMAEPGDAVEVISDEGTTAQLDPLRLSQFLLQKCLDAGVHLHQPARAISIGTDTRGELSRVRVADTSSSSEVDIPCSTLVVAAGAWSGDAFAALFPGAPARPPVASLAGHSLVVRSAQWGAEAAEDGCHAVFMTLSPDYSPEIFSRAGGEIYVAGVNDAAEPLPPLATDARGRARRQALDTLRATARDVLGVHDLEVVREGLCFRPVTAHGSPIVGRVPDENLGPGVGTREGPGAGGVYMATGHGPWGISMSLGTGMVVAEMVQGRPLSADVSRLGFKA